MTAEEKCKVLKDLLSWAEMTKEQVIYMQERIYAVRTEQGVMIVKASNPQHALDIVGKEIINMKSVFNLSDDLISRQAAIDALDELHYNDREDWCFVLDTVEHIPSAQPFTEEQIQTMQEIEAAQVEKAYELGKADRPTGHWIEHDDERVLCECSECHEKYLLYEEHVLGRNFCPNCGCAMKGGEEE